MNKIILKINSWLLIIIGFIPIILSFIYMIGIVVEPSTPNSWDDLGKFIVVIGTIIVCSLNIPLIISGISTLKYIKGKNTYKLSKNLSIIGIVLYTIFIIEIIFVDVLGGFVDYVTGDINIKLKIIYSSIILFVFILPLLINIIELYKNKNSIRFKNLWRYYAFGFIVIGVVALGIIIYSLYRTSIINTNKIEVTEKNTYTYSDFKSELEKRGLVYKLPEGKMELTTTKDISAYDSNSKYGYEFSSGSYTDSYRLSVNTNRKFPMFVYDSYTSLIKKSDQTASYYYIGPEDWYINWYIYYIDGKIYAAIGDESEYGRMWETSLSKTKYGVVVSEEKDITIYNAKNNYYVKGGGILDTLSGTQRRSFPTVTDIYNEKCMKIRVVDKVDAETLDEIARELSPQYWKVYKKSN